jgi:RNA polymerase sigma-70 factor (ECF subfamily)
MNSTPASLLVRVRKRTDQEAWTRFVELYTPFLYSWARCLNLPPEEAADLVQDVFTLLVQKLPKFEYRQQGSFRRWLRAVALNKWREKRRRRAVSTNYPLPEDVPERADESFSEVEYRKFLIHRALELMQVEFQPTTWKACWEHVVSGLTAAEVARQLGISENAVYLAKSRVLRRLRIELAELMD